LVNVEANACGTPVVVFNTGGCPETISAASGIVVEENTVQSVENAIYRVYESSDLSKENCIQSAVLYNEKDKYQDYYALYCELMCESDE